MKAKNYFIKRFVFEAIGVGKKLSLISEEAGSKFHYLTSNPEATLKVDVLKGKTQIPETLEIVLADFIDVKGIKANGNRLTAHDVQHITISGHEEEELEAETKPVAADTESESEIEGEGNNEDAATAASEEDITEGESPEPETETETETASQPEVDVKAEVEEEVSVPAVKPKKSFERKAVVTPKAAPVAEVPPVVEPEPAKESEKVEAPAKPKKSWGSATPKSEENLDKEKPFTEAKEEPVPAAEPAKESSKVKESLPKKETPAAKPVKKIDFEITNPDDIKIDDKGQLGFF
jgi:topoisomerase-4 subunit A